MLKAIKVIITILVSLLLFLLPFQSPPKIEKESRGDRSAISMAEIGGYALGFHNFYFTIIEGRVLNLLALTLLIPIVISGYSLFKGHINTFTYQSSLLILGILLIIGTVYFLITILRPLAEPFIPFGESEFFPNPNLVAYLILLWMMGWTLYTWVQIQILFGRSLKRLNNFNKFAIIVLSGGFVLSLVSMWLILMERVELHSISIITMPFYIMSIMMVEVLNIESVSSSLSYVILLLLFVLPLLGQLVPLIILKNNNLFKLPKLIGLLAAGYLSISTLYSGGIIANAIDPFVLGLGSGVGILIMLLGQGVAFSMLLALTRDWFRKYNLVIGE